VNNKPLQYKENLAGIPTLIQVWFEMASAATFTLCLLPFAALKTVIIFFYGYGHPISIFIALLFDVWFGVLFVSQSIPAWNFFTPLGLRLFGWTIAQPSP